MFNISYFKKSEKFPVLEFIKKQSVKDQVKIIREIDLLKEFGTLIGMPHVRKIKGHDELWELRVTSRTNKYRIFYFALIKTNYVLLHAFKKKDQKTPKKEIEIAEKRKKLYLE